MNNNKQIEAAINAVTDFLADKGYITEKKHTIVLNEVIIKNTVIKGLEAASKEAWQDKQNNIWRVEYPASTDDTLCLITAFHQGVWRLIAMDIPRAYAESIVKEHNASLPQPPKE